MEGVLFFLITVFLWIFECSEPCSLGEFFGPYCRYINVRYYAEAVRVNEEEHFGSNCISIPPSSLGNVKVTLPGTTYQITWVRVNVKDEQSTSRLDITLLQADGSTLKMLSERRSVSNTTVDVQFEVAAAVVKYVIVRGAFSSSCDVYIGTGQNLVTNYKDKANMSSISNNQIASLCVDDNEATSCSSMKSEQGEWWKFVFPFPARIYAILLMNEDHDFQNFSRGHRLSIFAEDERQIWTHLDKIPVALPAYYYTVHTSDTAAEVKIAKVKKIHFNEIKMWGDYICGRSKFGPDCQHDCNCADPKEQCFKNTGGCPGGCACGYEGIDCLRKCDAESRKCLCASKHSWCNDGWQGPHCNESCPEGSWGGNCQRNCSKNCAGEGRCDPVDGKCNQGCKNGYRPPQCIYNGSSNLMYILAAFMAIGILALVGHLILRRQQNHPGDEYE